jgi:ketosteroid isomerase-like protein
MTHHEHPNVSVVREGFQAMGTASSTARDGSGAESKYTQIFHIRDGRATEVWGMAENDAAVDPFLDSLSG